VGVNDMMHPYDEDIMNETKANELGLVKGDDGRFYPPANMDEMQQLAEIKQQQMQENPFDSAQYRNIKMPDMPVQYGGGLAETLLNNDEVPEEIRKKYWHIFHKDNVLTFLDETRKANKLMMFDIIKIDMLNSMPYYDYTFDKELNFDIMRNVFETKLDRSMGIKGKNERILLNSQFTEQKMVSESGGSAPVREGFFKRLLGRR
jgi:hypothetical protein